MPAVARGSSGGGGAPRPRAPAAAVSPAAQGLLPVGLDRRLALALAAVVLGAGAMGALLTGHRIQRAEVAIGHGVAEALGRAGLRLERVRLQGVSTFAEADVLRAAGVVRDMPLAGLDLAAVRERVQAVGWVKSARILRLWPDTLVISADERRRLAVWQDRGHAQVVDVDGQPIPEADPGRFPDLPLVVGEGANAAAAAVLPLVQARPRLLERLDALVRVDGRRWDLRLKDGGVVQLPAGREDAALIQLDALDGRSRLLELGFARIDLRNADEVVVRPRGEAAPAMAAAPAPPAAGM